MVQAGGTDEEKSGALSARVGTDSAPCRTSPATQACDWVVSDSPCLVGRVLPDAPGRSERTGPTSN